MTSRKKDHSSLPPPAPPTALSARFTAGPWRFSRTKRFIGPGYASPWVCEVNPGIGSAFAANARLISLAPELYEYVASSASNGCATAIALIAKATARDDAVWPAAANQEPGVAP
jgi:hypothetical protein